MRSSNADRRPHGDLQQRCRSGAVHEAQASGQHEVYLMCENIERFVGEMSRRRIPCTDVSDEGWGLLTEVTLAGGGKLGVYQPRHARPEWK
jgi:hypothetical protein